MENKEKEPKTFIHPKAFEPATFILILLTSILGAIIGIQLISTLGVTPNTSIIGALIAMILARLPIRIMQRYRSVHRQNLIQTSISSATFGAANSLFIPISIPFVMGKSDLIFPALIGATFALFIDTFMLNKLFDSNVFPAKETWAPGVATAESIFAGHKGGRKAGLLGLGGLLGILGSMVSIPMSALGVAFIGNEFALSMFGIGLLLAQYQIPLFHMELSAHYIPHGLMIGAGIVALIQAAVLIFGKRKSSSGVVEDDSQFTRSKASVRKSLALGYGMYLIAALIIAIITGLMTKMSVGMFILFVVYASIAAIIHEIIVGIAAMYSGWFPSFAVALITLLVGIMIGFPAIALTVMIGFTSATGPAFADMGYDLKTGYILRGNGKNKKYELDGRKQQYISGLIAFTMAVILVGVSYHFLFADNLVPPVSKVFALTIKAGASATIAKEMAFWAIPGAIIQLIGGPNKQLGVMLATGLLVATTNAGWAVLVGILIRIIAHKMWGEKADSVMINLASGFIAGDALYSFGSSMIKSVK
ncbi:OPT/YSL family transporter [Lactiplantibacillus plantarum]|uniref:OPT/YSL family transporter n=1 Tax=Lactiplantibacillus plantarum TaxID=1590 RepID=UPI0009324BCA|nr:OPT/YSL family transporter [Lactiplantibacillus plantarum]